MKRVSFLLLSSLIMCSSFTSFPFITISNQNKQINSTLSYVSDWETNLNWSISAVEGGKVYNYKRELSGTEMEMLQNGIVVAYVKGYNFSSHEMKEKPLSVPFIFFSPDETTTRPVSWHIENSNGKEVILSMQMDSAMSDAFSLYQKNIQVRFFALSGKFMQQHNLTAEKLRNTSYNDLVSLSKVNP